MTGPETTTPADPPHATVERAPRRISLAWAAPVLALAALLTYLSIEIARERGPTITITFNDAEGLEPGAELVHRGIRVGVVRTVELNDSLDAVRIRAELAPHAEGLARAGTAFWIVRPEVSLQRVEGLETLLGPRYIEVRPDPEPGAPARAFDGLGTPPLDDASGALAVTLRARSAGGITPGSPVLYKGMPVGSVRAVTLASDASGVLIVAAVEARFAPIVRDNTRFWNAGGVGVDFGIFRGLTLQADSIDTVLGGAISMATPNRPGDPVGPGHEFDLATEADSDWLGWAPSIPLAEPDNADGPRAEAP